MNHSRRFWQIVGRHCPDYRRLDRELLDGWRRVPSWVFGEDKPGMTEKVDLSNEAIHWELGSSLSYGEYLQLDKILEAQKPLTYEHDEMMFIIVHQSSELWMRLMLHELRGVLECVRRDDLDPSFKMLARVSHVQTQLIATWDVLSTMTPSEYSAFRNALGRSSGFQSVQYRMLEFMLGNKHPQMVVSTSGIPRLCSAAEHLGSAVVI